MKIRISHLDIHEQAYYLIWGIYTVLIYLLSVSELSFVYSAATAVRIIKVATCFILMIMLLVNQRYSVRRLVAYSMIMALLLIILLQIKQVSFLTNILFILCFPRKNLNQFIRVDMFLKVISAIVIFSLCALGIVDNYVHVTNFAEKQSLGFSHPNILSTFIYAILIEWLYLRYGKMKLYDYCGILIIWYVVYKIAASRTTAYTFILMYILFICANISPRIFYHRGIKWIFGCIVPIMVVGSFVAVRLYEVGNPLGIALNTVMSGRLGGAIKAMHANGVHLFGQDIEFIGTRFAKSLSQILLVDNAYYNCLLQYGIIYFIVLCVMYTYVMGYSVRIRKIEITLFCTYYALTGFGESYMLDPIYNIMLLCIFGIRGISFEQA